MTFWTRCPPTFELRSPNGSTCSKTCGFTTTKHSGSLNHHRLVYGAKQLPSTTRMLCSASTWIGPTVDRVANGSLGRPSLPLREFYVPAVLELLLGGACELQEKGLIRSSMTENKISVLLDRHMRAARMANKHQRTS